MTCTRLFIGLTGLATAGFALSASPIDLVRQGNTAFHEGKVVEARDSYSQAEERATDPGLVAFNKAAACYRLGEFREAELHYRRCLDEAVGPRRAAALYNLGNCLLHRSDGKDAESLKQAIQFYRRCLRDVDASPELRADARHNLELTMLFWTKARAEAKQDQSSEPPPNENPPNQKENSREPRGMEKGRDPLTGDPKHGFQKQPVEPRPGARNPILTDGSPPPGSGSLPPIPDEDQHVPLPPEDTEAYLKQATERILREQRDYQKRSQPAVPRNVKDW